MDNIHEPTTSVTGLHSYSPQVLSLRFKPLKIFILLKEVLEAKKVLDWDTNMCCNKDITKYLDKTLKPAKSSAHQQFTTS